MNNRFMTKYTKSTFIFVKSNKSQFHKHKVNMSIVLFIMIIMYIIEDYLNILFCHCNNICYLLLYKLSIKISKLVCKKELA